jgi:GntR family transcriptional regulator of vanillate catabolism
MSARLQASPETSQITRAVLSVREMVLDGEFKAHDRMVELGLVERIGVSRTPLRLALAALEHEGLLRRLPGGGYVVREFTQGDVSDAIELRGVLEGTAARFAAERGVSRRELGVLATINEEIGRLVHRADYESFENYMKLNEAFHDQPGWAAVRSCCGRSRGWRRCRSRAPQAHSCWPRLNLANPARSS